MVNGTLPRRLSHAETVNGFFDNLRSEEPRATVPGK